MTFLPFHHAMILQPSVLSVLVTAVVLCTACVILLLRQVVHERRAYVTFPLLGSEQNSRFNDIVKDQWRKNMEMKYSLAFPGRQLFVLPTDLVHDYAWKPEHEISSNIDLRERLLGQWTRIGSVTPEVPGDPMHSLITFVKQDLNKNMTTFFPGVHQEVRTVIEERLGHSQDWKSSSAYWLSLNFTLRIFEHAYVGLDLCRNAEWNEAAMEYSSSAVRAVVALLKWPPWVRPVMAPFVKELQDLSRHFSTMESFLRPIVYARIQAIQNGQSEKAHDFIQWWVENVDGKLADTKAMTTSLIGLNFAGIRSTGVVLMQALFDLASRHEYVTPLCEELEKVIAEGGEDDLDPRAMGKLELMDSFLKESQRHVAQNILSVYRKVMSPLTLKDGTILPTGSYVCVPSIDPAVDPKSLTREFDGFRWARMRKDTNNDTKYLSVATGPDSLEFGYGSHACPGRFFAMNAIKAILAPTLLNYDLRLKDGDERPRPRYNRIGVLTPDMDRVVEFRRRKRGTIA